MLVVLSLFSILLAATSILMVVIHAPHLSTFVKILVVILINFLVFILALRENLLAFIIALAAHVYGLFFQFHIGLAYEVLNLHRSFMAYTSLAVVLLTIIVATFALIVGAWNFLKKSP
jgi:hypothetical protein